MFIRPAAAQQYPPDPRFGAVEAWDDPVAAAEAGVGWERILFYWSELQPNGPDDWNSYHVPDDRLSLAAGAGREVVGLLKSTPAWATDSPALCGVPRGLYLPIDDPDNLWATFVRRAAGTYAGRVDHWIIWNEPDIQAGTFGFEWCGSMEEYYHLLKVAYLAAHQANPNVTIHLAGATTWHDPAYLRNFLAVATQDPEGSEHGYFFDVVSLHIYFGTETIPDIFGATRAALAAYGLQKPIWLNETNAPSNSDPPHWDLPEANFNITLEEQAGFLLQSFALALSSGAERIAVYKWVDKEPQPGIEPFGIIRLDYSRRPAFDAYKLITTHYAGTVSAREDRQALYTVVTLDRGGLTTRVLWARTEADAAVSVPALAPRARLIDQTGAEQVIEPVDGQYALTLPRARCADKRGCIIGGTTYLLVEDTGSAPPAAETATPAQAAPSPETSVPAPTEAPTPIPADTATPLPTPTPLPTDTPMPSYTPVPAETSAPAEIPAPTPISAESPLPASLSTETPELVPTPTPTLYTIIIPRPSSPTEAKSEPPAWLVPVGLVALGLLATIISKLFRHRA